MESRLKGKLIVLLAFTLFILSLPLLVKGQDNTTIWRDEMNYQSADQLQAAGWTITHQAGVSFSGSAIILDGTQEDTAIHYSSHFPSGISNWKVEDKSRWTLGSHCGNSVTAVTDKHSYTFMADGWYSTFAFYRDGQKTTFGSFQENKNEWFTLSIEKQGNQINMYYNDELKSTYMETDTSSSNLIGADAVSPWRGGSEYDYFEVRSLDSNTTEPQSSLLSNPIVLGGIIGAVGVGVGGVLYFFVLGGGGAAGSAGGAGGSNAGGGGSIIQDHPPSPSNGVASTNPSGTSSSLSEGFGQFDEQMSNITDINDFWSDFVQDPTGNIASVGNPANDTQPNNTVDNGSSSETPQTTENTDPFSHTQNLTSTILQTVAQGEHLATEGLAQGTLSQEAYQHYLEQTTNIMEAVIQGTQNQAQAANDAINGSFSR